MTQIKQIEKDKNRGNQSDQRHQHSIPPHWSWVKLGDVCEFVYGKGLTKSKRNEKGKFPVYGSNGIVGYHNEFLVEGPCLIIGRKGAAGEVHLSTQNCWPIDTTYYIKPSGKYFLTYLYFVIKNLRLNALDKSTAIPGLNRDDAYKQNIPLPPLSEQKKIVEKIEELFSSLDAGVASLKKAKEQIRLYRQSVLSAAFSGKLTATTKDTQNTKNLSAFSELSGYLPDGWKWVRLGEVVKVVSGNTPKGLGNISNKGSLPFYKVSDMNTTGNEKIMSKSNLYLTSEELEKLKIKIYPRNTTIFPKRGGAILTNKKRLLAKDSSFDLNLMGLIPSKIVDYQYLHYWVIMLDLSTIYDGSNVPQINNKNVEPLDFPLPPLEEQTKIIEEIEKRFSEADNLEKAIDESLTKSETLRQSILKQAFEGKLL